MRGKIGLVIGLGAGYVLGTRAGRARYEQIKKQAEKVWELPPVQKQVDRVKAVAKRLPGAAIAFVQSKTSDAKASGATMTPAQPSPASSADAKADLR